MSQGRLIVYTKLIIASCCCLAVACTKTAPEPAGGPAPVAPKPVTPVLKSLGDTPAVLLPSLSGVDKLFASPKGHFLAGERRRSQKTILVHDVEQNRTREFIGTLLGPPDDDGLICYEEGRRTGEVVFSDGRRLALAGLMGLNYTLSAGPGCSHFVANERTGFSEPMVLWGIDGDGRMLWKRNIGRWGGDHIALSPGGTRLAYNISKSSSYVDSYGMKLNTSAGFLELIDFSSGKTVRSVALSERDRLIKILFVDEKTLLVLEGSGFMRLDLDAKGDPRVHIFEFNSFDSARAGPGKVLVIDRASTHGSSFSMPQLECGLNELDLASGVVKRIPFDLGGACPLRMVFADGKVFLAADH